MTPPNKKPHGALQQSGQGGIYLQAGSHEDGPFVNGGNTAFYAVVKTLAGQRLLLFKVKAQHRGGDT